MSQFSNSENLPSSQGAAGAHGGAEATMAPKPNAYSTYAHHSPSSTGNHPSSVSDIMRQVPVQQCFNGPAATFVSVFQQPGEYDINVHFQQHQRQQREFQSKVPRYTGSRGQGFEGQGQGEDQEQAAPKMRTRSASANGAANSSQS